MKLLNLIIFTFLLFGLCNSYGESDSNGNPNYLERESHNLLNVVRMFPTNYKSDFMPQTLTGLANILTPSIFPSVKPVYYYNSINRMAKAHSFDMSTNGCFQHNDCNNTDIWTRFGNWESCVLNGAVAENIASGTQTGLSTNNLLICESGSSCPNDTMAYETIGHRTNIMGSSYSTVGVGNIGTYWTQDFEGSQCQSAPVNPIYTGFHTYNPSGSANPTYLVSFYSKSLQASKMQIVFNSASFDMTLKYGNSSFGFYSYSTTYVACQQYYFSATLTNGSTVRYPDTGYLQTTPATKASCLGWALAKNTTSQTTTSQTTASQTTSSQTTSSQTTSSQTTTSQTTASQTTTSKTTASQTTTSQTTTSQTTTSQSTTSSSTIDESDDPNSSNILKPFSLLVSLILLINLI